MAAHERVEVIPNTVSLEIVRRDFPGALEWLVSDLTSNGFTTTEAQDTIEAGRQRSSSLGRSSTPVRG